ncbi:hypothetical protein Bbelb_297540, partial [Branchiostoma belcheri]
RTSKVRNIDICPRVSVGPGRIEASRTKPGKLKGFLLYYMDELILGFSGDSGFNPELYDKIFSAPTVVVDGRTPSSQWHASFDEISAYLKSREKKPRAVYVTGYGTAAEYTTHDSAITRFERGLHYTLWSGENECPDLTNEGTN